MSMTCSICKHPERAAIDAALIAGTSCRDIAGRYDCSKTAVNRHAEHIQGAIRQTQEAQALDIARQLDNINQVVTTIMYNALRDKKGHGLALAASDRILKQLDFQHRVNQLSELEKEVEALKQLLQANGESWQP